MERLTGLDGAFLSLESPTTHLQILGALIFDPGEVEGGVDFWSVRDMVAGRVHLVPPFRKRMIEVPFGLQQPSMVDDPDFDIDFHVRRARLPDPGGLAELAVLAADLASRPLDRRRPLWEFHVVEGLEHGHLAVIPKVHHSIIDGVSGAEVLAAFFDLEPKPAPRRLFAPHPGVRSMRRPDAGDRPSEESPPAGATPDAPPWSPDPLPAPFAAPRTSINRAISPHRRVAFAALPLRDVRRVREVLGGTANDVVLAATSGAMRAFFADRGEVLDRSLVAMVPVSVRAPSERDALGNRVSALLVSLASGVEDAAARFRHIRDGMETAKEQSRSIGPDVFAGWAQAILPAVGTRLSRIVTNLRLFDHLAPVFNLIVSNVPGPDFPLYLAGARMVAMYPLGPIVEGVGVNVTVFSYLDTMYAGVQACWDLAPDIDTIARGLEHSLDELVHEADRRVRPVPWWHAELPA